MVHLDSQTEVNGLIENTWLSLNEYSTKHNVSISTLRRRIKTHDIEYQFQDGKYFLKDTPATDYRPQVTVAPPPQQNSNRKVEKPVQTPVVQTSVAQNDSMIQQLLGEIKKAYAVILQEKEEQIIQLKEEVSDLKTLVRVLEDENLRLRSVDSWLKEIEGPNNT